MPLAAGTRLGPYEVLGMIGAGGMGEVYKARDTRLDRTVAIKVLPPDVSSDPERRARFEREAKTIAGLSHPHICTLHDVGEHNGVTFLVMELLQGEPLADRLVRGRLPLEQALTIATEIADALAAAHRQGGIHRDLKPGNVMLTKSGAKLLDFGLAKLKGHGAEEPAAGHLASMPTRSAPLTAEGTIVGTLQYEPHLIWLTTSSAVMPHVRICGGGDQRWSFLLRLATCRSSAVTSSWWTHSRASTQAPWSGCFAARLSFA